MPMNRDYDRISHVCFSTACGIFDSGCTILAPMVAVALTAYSRVEDRTRAMLAGYQYHLAKLVDAAELITTLGMVTQRLPRPSRKI